MANQKMEHSAGAAAAADTLSGAKRMLCVSRTDPFQPMIFFNKKPFYQYHTAPPAVYPPRDDFWGKCTARAKSPVSLQGGDGALGAGSATPDDMGAKICAKAQPLLSSFT
jgi:hypothetical protein